MALTKVSTDGVKDDAITKTKIPANQIEASELADNAVDTNAIADQAVALSKLPHGTSSNDGKFLRANNGADPTFETVTSTTINNNADNRVITGSGTANTLNGESLVTIDSSGRLSVAPSAGGSGITLASQGSTYGGTVKLRNTVNSNHDWLIGVGGGDGAYVAGRGLMIRDDTTGANRIAVSTAGYVGIGTVNPQVNFHVKVSGTDSSLTQLQTASYSSYVGTAHADNNIGNGSKAGNLVLRGQTGVAITGNNGTATQVKVDADGLKFGSDTAAANALDDYEEGTWTPTLHGTWYNSGTFNNSVYTKIGRLVTVSFDLYRSANNMGWQSGASIRGFPFGVYSSGYITTATLTTFSYTSSSARFVENYFDSYQGGNLFLHTNSQSSNIRHLWCSLTYTSTS